MTYWYKFIFLGFKIGIQSLWYLLNLLITTMIMLTILYPLSAHKINLKNNRFLVLMKYLCKSNKNVYHVRESM